MRPKGLNSSLNALTSYFIYRVREIVNAWPHRSDIDVKGIVADFSEHEKVILHYTWSSVENFMRSHAGYFRLDNRQGTVQALENDDSITDEAISKSEAAFRCNAADVLPPQSFVPIQCVSVFFDEISTKRVKHLLEEDAKLKATYHLQKSACFYIPNSTRKCETNFPKNGHDSKSQTSRMRLGKATEQFFVVNRKWYEECGMNFSTYSTMLASFFCNRLKEDFLLYGLPSYWILLAETLKTAEPAIQKIVTFIGIKRFALLFDREEEAQVALVGAHSRPWVRNISRLEEKSVQPDENTKALFGDAAREGELLSEADVRYCSSYALSPRELTLLALSLPCGRSIATVRSMNYPSVKDMYRRLTIPESLITNMFPQIFRGKQNDPSKSSSLVLTSNLTSRVRNYFSVRLADTSTHEEERITQLLYDREFDKERKKLFKIFLNPDAMNGLGIKPLSQESSHPPMTTENILHSTMSHLKEFESIAYRDLLGSIMEQLSEGEKESFKKGVRQTHHNLLALLGDYPQLFYIREISETINQKTVYYHIVTRGPGTLTANVTIKPAPNVKTSNLKKLRGPTASDDENPYHDTDNLLKLLIRIRGERSGEINQGNLVGALPMQAKQVIRQSGGLGVIMQHFSKYFSSVERDAYGGTKTRSYSLTPDGLKLYKDMCTKNS